MIFALTLNWNGLDKLKKLRDNLLINLSNSGQDFKWYIRDNGSKDNSVSEISTWPEVVLKSVNHNRDNFAQGVNSLAAMTNANNSDYYLLLNNDVEFGDAYSIKNMLNLMGPDVGIVGARLMYPNSNTLSHAGVILSKRYGEMPFHYRYKEKSDQEAEKNRYFQAVTAAVCLVRVSDFNAVGGMDTKFNWAFEDIDLNLSIGQLGKKIIYCGQTLIYHEESASLKRNPVNKLFMDSNVRHFRSKWSGKYELDHDKYLNDKNYNLC